MKNIKSLVMVGLLSASMLVSVGCQSTSDLTSTHKDIINKEEMDDVIIVDDELLRITAIDKVYIDGNVYGYSVIIENKGNEKCLVKSIEDNIYFFVELGYNETVEEFVIIKGASNFDEVNIEDVMNMNYVTFN